MKYTLYSILILLIVSWFIPVIPTKGVATWNPSKICVDSPSVPCNRYETKIEWKTLKEIINHY